VKWNCGLSGYNGVKAEFCRDHPQEKEQRMSEALGQTMIRKPKINNYRVVKSQSAKLENLRGLFQMLFDELFSERKLGNTSFSRIATYSPKDRDRTEGVYRSKLFCAAHGSNIGQVLKEGNGDPFDALSDSEIGNLQRRIKELLEEILSKNRMGDGAEQAFRHSLHLLKEDRMSTSSVTSANGYRVICPSSIKNNLTPHVLFNKEPENPVVSQNPVVDPVVDPVVQQKPEPVAVCANPVVFDVPTKEKIKHFLPEIGTRVYFQMDDELIEMEVVKTPDGIDFQDPKRGNPIQDKALLILNGKYVGACSCLPGNIYSFLYRFKHNRPNAWRLFKIHPERIGTGKMSKLAQMFYDKAYRVGKNRKSHPSLVKQSLNSFNLDMREYVSLYDYSCPSYHHSGPSVDLNDALPETKVEQEVKQEIPLQEVKEEVVVKTEVKMEKQVQVVPVGVKSVAAAAQELLAALDSEDEQVFQKYKAGEMELGVLNEALLRNKNAMRFVKTLF